LIVCGNTLGEADRILRQNIPESSTGLKVFLIFIITASFIGIELVVRYISYNEDLIVTTSRILYHASYGSTLLPYFNESALLVHFTKVAKNIAQRFKALNAKMKEIVVRKNALTWRNQYQDDFNTVPFDENNTFACDMETLMSTYWLLCDAVHHANVFYSHQLLAVISFLFVNITCNLYYSYLEIGGNIWDLCNLLLWSSAQILYLVWMITSSTSVSESVTMLAC
ncbi:hypothetical protein J6590_019642, partial [Homalodisca vitripennis]